MAFTFDATPGGSAANSYVSISDANDYFAAHLETAFWEVPTGQKQSALVMATRRLNSEVYGGQQATKTQSLAWPRSYISTYDSTTIPAELTQATCEMALHYLKQVAGEFSVDDRDLETLTTYKVGPLDFGIRSGYKADALPQRVRNLLAAIGVNGWIENTTSHINMVR